MVRLPRCDPLPDARVRDAFTAIERGECCHDARDLAFVSVEVRGDRLGREERAGASRGARHFSRRFLSAFRTRMVMVAVREVSIMYTLYRLGCRWRALGMGLGKGAHGNRKMWGKRSGLSLFVLCLVDRLAVGSRNDDPQAFLAKALCQLQSLASCSRFLRERSRYSVHVDGTDNVHHCDIPSLPIGI
jgi:hypothetical protein